MYGPQSGVRRQTPGNTGGVSAGLSQSKQGIAQLSSLPTSPSRRSNSRGLNQGSRRNLSSGRLSPRQSSPRHATSRKSNGAMISTPSTRHNTDKENEGSSSKTKRYPKDYSAYKGHGRYAAGVRYCTYFIKTWRFTDSVPASTGKTTLNSLYQIDSVQNGGLEFQFDDVVRNKDQRKHLHADDCECCRDVRILAFHLFRVYLNTYDYIVLRVCRAAPTPSSSTVVAFSRIDTIQTIDLSPCAQTSQRCS